MTETSNIDKPEYAAGSWGAMLQESTVLKIRAGKVDKRAGKLLWDGAKAAIAEWDSGTDPSGESLYDEVKEALGNTRRGDANKIKTVAIATENHGLDISQHQNLSQAYNAARALIADMTKGKTDADEDDAAERVVESLDAPKTASTAEAAAKVLLGKGIDGAVVAIFDALTTAAVDADTAEKAIRSFLRSATSEAASRAKHRADEARAAKEAEKEKDRAAKAAEREKARAERESAKPKAAPRKASEKPVAKKAEKATAAKPVAKKPVARPKPVAKPVAKKPVARPKPAAEPVAD